LNAAILIWSQARSLNSQSFFEVYSNSESPIESLSVTLHISFKVFDVDYIVSGIIKRRPATLSNSMNISSHYQDEILGKFGTVEADLEDSDSEPSLYNSLQCQANYELVRPYRFVVLLRIGSS
jgi:hypothetical protein